MRQALEGKVLERMSSGDLKSICRNKRLESLIFKEKFRSGFRSKMAEFQEISSRVAALQEVTVGGRRGKATPTRFNSGMMLNVI